MHRTEVESSNLVSIGYDGGKRILEVEFRGGRVYQYDGVPSQVHDGLMAAESHGRYLNEKVKGTFGYRRIA